MYDTRLIDLVEHIEDSYNEDNMLLKEEINTYGQNSKETD
jgi:hypothetical protein